VLKPGADLNFDRMTGRTFDDHMHRSVSEGWSRSAIMWFSQYREGPTYLSHHLILFEPIHIFDYSAADDVLHVR
jgi:hypothetical protein